MTHVDSRSMHGGDGSMVAERQDLSSSRFETRREIGGVVVRAALDLLLVGCVAFALWWCVSSAL
jgi:hypothetical protein